MKTKITLVRHAETNANLIRAFSGRREVPISSYGYQQISDLTKVLANKSFAAVFSSPMSRAIETVKPTATRLGLNVILDDDLLELSYGVLEGTPRDEIKDKFPDVWEFFIQYDYFSRVEDGEEIEEGVRRFTTCLKRLASIYEGQSILVATHGMLLRAFYCSIKNIPWTEFQNTKRVKNTAIGEVVYDSDTDTFYLLDWNNTNHEEIL